MKKNWSFFEKVLYLQPKTSNNIVHKNVSIRPKVVHKNVIRMERDLYKTLINWKKSENRKQTSRTSCHPLVDEAPHQSGLA